MHEQRFPGSNSQRLFRRRSSESKHHSFGGLSRRGKLPALSQGRNQKIAITTNCVMILPLLQNMKMQIIVMPAWIAGIQVRKDASRKHPCRLIIMKAMQTVTAVLGRTDRGGDTLWKTLHWMFTSITPGHESRTRKVSNCMQVGWHMLVGASNTSCSDGLPARP